MEEQNELLKKVSDIAVRALIYEVAVTPKPGLVDRHNNGAHSDMNYYTFLDSAFSLKDYFYQVALSGYSYEGEDKKELFRSIRGFGKEAEKKMYQATNGVNTHKGLIFSMGLICCGVGNLLRCGNEINVESICLICKEMTEGIVEGDFAGVNALNARTNGEKLYVQYGVTGIRGEAESGFPIVREIAYPVFMNGMRHGLSFEAAGIMTLLSIMKVLEDTNVLSRHDFKTLKYVKDYAGRVLKDCVEESNIDLEAVERMDQLFIEKNISPGGAADNLAVTIAIYFFDELN